MPAPFFNQPEDNSRRNPLPRPAPVLYVFYMTDSRVTVTPSALRMALRVWMKVAPTRLWRELEKQDKAARDAPGSTADALKPFDARNAVAEYVAEKIEQANWQITHPEPKALGSPPPWSGKAN